MSLPNPDKARKIISFFEEDQRLKEESEKARKRKEVAIRKKAKEEIDALLRSALKIAYEGRSFFTISRNNMTELQNFIEDDLKDLGFEVYKVFEGIKSVEYKISSIDDEFNRLLNLYKTVIKELQQHINSWLFVRHKRDGTFNKISSDLMPLIFDSIKISDKENDWRKVMESLNSWCVITDTDEPGTYQLASLVFDDDGFYEASNLTDMVLNPARENVLASHAKNMRKIAIELRSIQEQSYGNLSATLKLLSSLDKNSTLLSWLKPSTKVQVHGKLSAWILAWISQGQGIEFLDDFSLEVESLARLGIKELDLAGAIFQFEKVGLNNEDCIALLKSLDFEIINDNDETFVRWS